MTWSDWSHVDIVHGEQAIGAHPWRGVIEQPISHVMETQPHWALASIFVNDEDAAWEFARNQLGKPYDYGGIVNFLGLGRAWDEDVKWMCSELAAATLQAGNAVVFSAQPKRITPRDLSIHPALHWEQFSSRN